MRGPERGLKPAYFFLLDYLICKSEVHENMERTNLGAMHFFVI